jgi:hypothetical protein
VAAANITNNLPHPTANKHMHELCRFQLATNDQYLPPPPFPTKDGWALNVLSVVFIEFSEELSSWNTPRLCLSVR